MASNLLEERIPPQAIDAEMAVLGSMLLEADAVTEALEILKPEHFYKEAHQRIEEKTPADPAGWRGVFDAAGG